MARVSVIIPTYNRERFVTGAIDSVLKQTYRDYEIVVVDDGSTDGTEAVLQTYGQKVTYIFQENAGVSSARNKGIELSTGEWVAFLDSDDEWDANYLASQMGRASQFPEAVGHMTNAVTISVDGTRSGLFEETAMLGRFRGRPYLYFRRPLRIIVQHAPWFVQASIFRREALLAAGLFDTELSIAEDLDVIARVALQGPFTFFGTELVAVIRRAELLMNLGAQSLTKGIYRYRAFGRAYNNLLRYQGLTLAERTAIRRAQSRNLRSLGNVLVMAGQGLEARESYQRALHLCPSVRSLVKYAGTFLPAGISRALVRRGRDVLPGEDPGRDKSAGAPRRLP